MPGMGRVEAAIEQAFRRYHMRAQIIRFLGAFGTTLIATLSSGKYNWTVSALAPVVVATAWTVAREMWPTIPLALVRAELRADPPRVEPGTRA